MSDTNPHFADVVRLIEKNEIDTVIVAFPDAFDRLMGKRVPADYFKEKVMEAHIHACDYLLTCDMELDPLPGFSFSSWDSGYGDMLLKPDTSTLRVVPWFEGSALVLCDLLRENGEPVEQSPRRVLKRQIEACRQRGLIPMMASELEFYLFEGLPEELAKSNFSGLEPTTPYLIDYHILGTTTDEAVLREVRNLMPIAGIPIESSKGEWGRGQHEVNLQYCDALQMADRHVIFKEGVKWLAKKQDRSATFIHTSLQIGSGQPAFFNEESGQPTDIFNSFLAGCMHHAGHLSALFAPTANSYKRYRSSSFAPVSVAWDEDNRTCGFRVVGSGEALRIENRIPGADVNPYLAFAATLAAGLDGIDKKMQLAPAVKGNAYAKEGVERVPSTLSEALRLLREGSLAREAFGEEVVEHYVHLGEMEQAALENQVTDAELRRYFERI